MNFVAFGHDDYKGLSAYHNYFGYGDEYKQEVMKQLQWILISFS